MEAHVVGVDLAWSPKNWTGVAGGVVQAGTVTIQETTRCRTLDEIVAFVERHAKVPATIAVDAPAVVPHADRMRDCEVELHRIASLRRAHAVPYPGTRALLGKCNAGRPRGEELVDRLKRELGVEEVGGPPTRHSGRYAIDVFPAAAMVGLFGLRQPLVYKKKRRRSWEECQKGLSEYQERLKTLRDPGVTLPDDLAVDRLTGQRFKDVEDGVDAALCAYIAALAWLGKVRVVGDLAGGYIVLPDAVPRA